MINKYMRRGVLLLLAGVGLNLAGRYLQLEELDVYKWAMGLGTVLFGIGFLLILYGLIRKVERAALLEERAEAQEEAEQPVRRAEDSTP
jgi:hypothetical protein